MIDWPPIDVVRGDMRTVLRDYAADTFHSCVTDPPYGISFMGKGWDHGVPGVDYWREVLRVLKPGAHLAAFGGTRSFHRLACAIEDAGFEIRDSIGWHHMEPVFCQCYEPTALTVGPVRDVWQTDTAVRVPPSPESPSVLFTEVSRERTNGAPETDSPTRQQGLDGGGARESSRTLGRREKPSMEGRGDAETREGQLLGGEVRPGAELGATDGEERRLHHGTPAHHGDHVRAPVGAGRGGSPPRQHAGEQRDNEPRTLAVEWIAQGDGVWPGCPRCHKPLAPPFEAGPLAWNYGTGFPKGLDVAKAIDKRRHDRDDVLEVTRWIRDRRDAVGVSNADIDAAFGFNGMAGHWTSVLSQPQVPTLDQVPALLTILKTTEAELPERVRALIVELNGRKGEFSANWHAREITGAVEEWDDRQNYAMTSRDGLRRDRAHSTEAQSWEGWNTALKPAWEPILLARKPLPNGWPLAATVLEHGTGALNIGACGVDFASDDDKAAAAAKNRHADFDSDARGDTGIYGADHRKRGNYDAEARWPANVITDPEAAAFIDEQAGAPVSRVYYCAKASRDERDAGLAGLAGLAVTRYGEQGQGPEPQQTPRRPVLQANFHPTVKPLDLMRWVCRLITPPGGHVVDPFSGSGSTLCAATLEGFQATGIDLDTDPETGEPIGYTAIARARAEHWRAEAIRIAEGGARPPAVAERDQLDIF